MASTALLELYVESVIVHAARTEPVTRPAARTETPRSNRGMLQLIVTQYSSSYSNFPAADINAHRA